MRPKVALCLLVYLATVKAIPASPHLSDLTPFHIPDLAPNLRNRADAKFVTIYGLYDNSFHAPSSDNSKPKLAPITEAFMAMTRALATATVTGTGSRSVEPTPAPTPPHKMSPPPLGPGLAVPPTPVQSSIASTSSGTSQDSLEALQLGARLRSHRLVVFGSVIAGVIFLALLLFFLLDPRMMRKLCRKKVDSNLPFSSKKSHGRPVPAWDVTPISSADYVFTDETTEKNFFAKKHPDDAIVDILPKHLASKFSVCSSEYPPSSASDSEPGSDTPKIPVRPPRPPTADSPALSESVYLACADQPFIIIAPQPFMEDDFSLVKPLATPPSQRPLTPREFLDMYSITPRPTANNSDIDTTLLSNETLESCDTRHSRTHSAPPLVGFTNDGISDVPEFPVFQRLMKHRRSRSASGWAYPDRPNSKEEHKQPSNR